MAVEGSPEGQVQLTPETEALAEVGRTGVQAPPVNPLVKPEDAPAADRPAWLPEKFKSPEAMAEAYAALEKRLGGGDKERLASDAKTVSEETEEVAAEETAETPAETAEETPEETSETDPLADFTAAQQEAVKAAREAYEGGGTLPDEHREALRKSGFDDETIDTYLAGVAAIEKAVQAEVFGTAGSEDAYNAAAAWAMENWSPAEIAAHDAALENPELRVKAVKNLMREFGEANPGEGQLTDIRGGSQQGDVYANREEYLADLQKADSIANRNEALAARRQVVEKLQRSRKAGTVKMARSGPFSS